MRRAGSLVAAVATLAVASTASAAREPAQAEKAAIARAVVAYCASGDACGDGKKAGKMLVSTADPRWAVASVGSGPLVDGCTVILRRSGRAWKPLACGIDWGAYSLDYAPGPPPGDDVPEDVLADFEDLIDP